MKTGASLPHLAPQPPRSEPIYDAFKLYGHSLDTLAVTAAIAASEEAGIDYSGLLDRTQGPDGHPLITYHRLGGVCRKLLDEEAIDFEHSFVSASAKVRRFKISDEIKPLTLPLCGPLLQWQMDYDLPVTNLLVRQTQKPEDARRRFRLLRALTSREQWVVPDLKEALGMHNYPQYDLNVYKAMGVIEATRLVGFTDSRSRPRYAISLTEAYREPLADLLGRVTALANPETHQQAIGQAKAIGGSAEALATVIQRAHSPLR